jgi:hypothetical protein
MTCTWLASAAHYCPPRRFGVASCHIGHTLLALSDLPAWSFRFVSYPLDRVLRACRCTSSIRPIQKGSGPRSFRFDVVCELCPDLKEPTTSHSSVRECLISWAAATGGAPVCASCALIYEQCRGDGRSPRRSPIEANGINRCEEL